MNTTNDYLGNVDLSSHCTEATLHQFKFLQLIWNSGAIKELTLSWRSPLHDKKVCVMLHLYTYHSGPVPKCSISCTGLLALKGIMGQPGAPSSLYLTALCCTALHWHLCYIALCCTAQQLHTTAQLHNCTTTAELHSNCTTALWAGDTSGDVVFNWDDIYALPYTTLHCTALHCTALHCTALCCASLHCTVSSPHIPCGQGRHIFSSDTHSSIRKFHRIKGTLLEIFPNVEYDALEEVGGTKNDLMVLLAN